MRRSGTTGSVLVALVFGLGAAAAHERRLDARAVLNALAIGQSRSEMVRATFHRPYRLVVSQPPVDAVDVITPYRRVVLAAEAQAALGNRLFGQRDALAALGDAPERVELRAELTFHPQNVLAAVPEYEIQLLARAASIPSAVPRVTERTPRLGPRLPDGFVIGTPEGPGTRALPLVGGTVAATFDGADLDPNGVYEVLVVERRAIVARTVVDFAALR